MCEAKTSTERDSAIRATLIRLMVEPDKEVQEALLLWQAHRLGITLGRSVAFDAFDCAAG